MISIGRTSLSGVLAVLAGCASAGTGSKTTAAPGVWSGSFRQPQMAASAVVGPATPGRGAAYGNITLTPEERRPRAYRVELSISAPVEPNTHLAWAIFSGPCGSTAPAMAPLNDFPPIDVTSAGGSVRTEMMLALEPRGSYHATVYWGSRATDVSNVMMCANLVLS